MSAGRVWQSDRARVLDSEELRAAMKTATGTKIPGTGEKFDGRVVATEVVDFVVSELSEPERGTHVETALSTLGALAGFSAQMGIREDFIKSGKITEEQAFVTMVAKNGTKYFFGDLLNELLIEPQQQGQLCIWGLVGGGAQSLGAKELPNMRELFGYVSGTLGSDKFGVPRLPPEHMPRLLPIELLNKFWNPVRNILVMKLSSPGAWTFAVALAAQIAIIRAKAVIDAALAAKIVMESAVPMSKVDPVLVYRAYFAE